MCLHLNLIFPVLANHSQPSPGLDLFKPEGKLYLLLFKTAETRRATFKGFFSLLTPAPHPDLIDFFFFKVHSPSIMQERGWEDMKFAIL